MSRQVFYHFSGQLLHHSPVASCSADTRVYSSFFIGSIRHFVEKGKDKVQATIRWMAVILAMVGTSLGQAPPPAQTTAPHTPAPATAPAPTADANGGTISGTVKAGAVPLPGVA